MSNSSSARAARSSAFFLMGGVAAALFLFAVPSARADELSSWYSSDPRASAYSSVRDDLQGVFFQAKKTQVPLWILGEKLREGASKKVPADTLLRCVRGEEARLERAQAIIARSKTAGAGTSATFASRGDRSLKAVGIYLRAGLPEPLVGDLLTAGAAAPGGEDAALSACESIVTLKSLAHVGDADSLAIGRLLIAKSSEPLGYSSLGPVFARGRARGLNNDRIVKEVVLASLSSGGGLAVMNDLIEKFPQPAPRAFVRAPVPRKAQTQPEAALSPASPAEEPTTAVTLPPLRITAPPGSGPGRTPGVSPSLGITGPGTPASQGAAPASMGPSGGKQGGN